MRKITPFLWFDNNAEEAVKFYTSIFKNSKIKETHYYGENMPLPKGTVLTIDFELNGEEFAALNGGPVYSFTPALSLAVYCEDQAEVDYLWEKLVEGGSPVQCGWLQDKYGLSWQIIPKDMNKYLFNPDPVKASKAMAAMMKMIKLDIEEIKKAAEE